MPEEVNRVVTDHVSEMLFAPTSGAAEQLRHEGIVEQAIHVTGDVMYDAALQYGRLAEQRSDALERLGLRGCSFVLATIHCAANTDDPHRLQAILLALADCCRAGTQVVLPLHPRTRAAIDHHGLHAIATPLMCIPPVSYLDMLLLERSACLIVTDSGGVQKEAYFSRTPCVTVREQTEWPELVQMGWNRLACPRDAARLARVVQESLLAGRPDESHDRPYGDGRAGAGIAHLLVGARVHALNGY